MLIVENATGTTKEIEILPVVNSDYRRITKGRYWFDWKVEKDYEVYKLVIKETNDILGLVSINTFPRESRIEIRLLATSKENRGKKKIYDHIIGNLIAFVCALSLKQFGAMACVSLVPKTDLVTHYMSEYGMSSAGKSLFLDGYEMLEIIQKYY